MNSWVCGGWCVVEFAELSFRVWDLWCTLACVVLAFRGWFVWLFAFVGVMLRGLIWCFVEFVGLVIILLLWLFLRDEFWVLMFGLGVMVCL